MVREIVPQISIRHTSIKRLERRQRISAKIMKKKTQQKLIRGLAILLAILTIAGTFSFAFAAETPSGSAQVQEGPFLAYDQKAVTGADVQALAKDPEHVHGKDLTVFVITKADTAGTKYTKSTKYTDEVAEAKRIAPEASFQSYHCYDGSNLTGLLFIEADAETTGAKALVDKLMVKGLHIYPETIEMEIYVKANASTASVEKGIEAQLKAEQKDLPIASINWPADMKFEAGSMSNVEVVYNNSTTATLTLLITVLESSGVKLQNQNLPAINATAQENASSADLLRYINSDLRLVEAGNAAYEAALGEAPSVGEAGRFSWNHSKTSYAAKGGLTYTFVQTYKNGDVTSTLTRTLTVNSESQSLWWLSINYDNNTISTTNKMRWSLRDSYYNNSWSYCTNNMAIRSDWYDKTVYFYQVGDKYTGDSGVVSLYIPPKADKPTDKLDLSVTSHSVTINNCWDYGDVEYRIGNGNWFTTSKETYTFDGLSSNTSYTVYVRNRANRGDNLASDALTASVRTSAAVITNVNVDNRVEDRVGIIDAEATISNDQSYNQKTLSGKLTSSNMTKFNNVLNTYLDRYDGAKASLLIHQYMEDNEPVEPETFSFSMPMGSISKAIKSAGLSMEYRCNYGYVKLDNSDLEYFRSKNSYSNLSITVKKVKDISRNSSWKWLREMVADGEAILYNLSVGTSSSSKAPTLEWAIPYTIRENETIDGLSVYRVDNSGNRSSISFDYDATNGVIRFPMSENGYVAITTTRNRTTVLPFQDVNQDGWAYQYILFGYEKGLFAGTSANTFSPTFAINRATIFTLMARLDGFTPQGAVDTSWFKDVPANEWYAPYAVWAKDKGLIKDKTFDPMGTMTRQEIAKVLYNYLQKSGFDVSVDMKEIERYADHSDIAGGNVAAVYFLREAEIMSGHGNNIFEANGNVTREQMAAILYRMYSYIL